MVSHSKAIIKFTESLKTNFFNKLEQKPSWTTDEIRAEFFVSMIETLNKTIDEINEKFHNLFKGGK